MTDIDVRCERTAGGWLCSVRIADERSASEHEVAVRAADLARLAPGASRPDDLVRRSVGFLLAREPKESILGRFDLMAIARYFPDFERTIGR